MLLISVLRMIFAAMGVGWKNKHLDMLAPTTSVGQEGARGRVQGGGGGGMRTVRDH